MTIDDRHLPGRLGDPNATLESDNRADPRIVAAIQAMPGPAPGLGDIDASATYEEALEYCLVSEEAGAAVHDVMRAAMPVVDSITTSVETIKGGDDNDIRLHIHRPKSAAGPLPCLVHTHGGGMVMMSTEDPAFVRWRNSLAEMGMVAIGVEFRNGGGRLGNHPFPAGLEDCASATKWTYANREDLGISTIVISGESGGGNLAIATTLKANREGWVDQIDGVYAMCPYISGRYAERPPELLSLYENDGYMLECSLMAALVKVYDPNGDHFDNPLAWPLSARSGDLAGLPPHVISVNELDPLRDEGLAYYRKLLGASVSAVARTVHGTPHAGDLGFPDMVPDVYAATLGSVVGFANSL